MYHIQNILLVTCQNDNTPSSPPQVKDFQFGVSPVHYSVSEYLTKVRQRKIGLDGWEVGKQV